jgi:hypothetical protein
VAIEWFVIASTPAFSGPSSSLGGVAFQDAAEGELGHPGIVEHLGGLVKNARVDAQIGIAAAHLLDGARRHRLREARRQADREFLRSPRPIRDNLRLRSSTYARQAPSARV